MTKSVCLGGYFPPHEFVRRIAKMPGIWLTDGLRGGASTLRVHTGNEQ
jgi:hypothetical protein